MALLGNVSFRLLLVAAFAASGTCLNESDRILEYHARNYTWPIQQYVPDTPGWRRLYEHRFRQVSEIETRKQRYEGWMQSIEAAVIAPNFTEFGFGLARAPDDLMEALRQGIQDGLAKGPRTETKCDVIIAEHQPWFIDRPDLTQRVLDELQYYPETWANIELSAWGAYGFRLYRNDSQLLMHVDKSQTHVVSFILHIDSSDDAESWPIMIEDFHGNVHEVILTSGDVLLYESSKCFHGRPKRFRGSWYSSIFAHYYPKYGWKEIAHTMEKHYAIPPHWNSEPTEPRVEIPLEMVGTGMKEPTCPNDWCQSQFAKTWSGPGKEGHLVQPSGEIIPFNPGPVDCKDNHDKCPEWASWDTDECKRIMGFMLTHCQLSCGHCTPGRGAPGNEEL